MKGWRTILFNLLIAIIPAALTYLIGVDWTHVVNPDVAAALVGAMGILLRGLTTTPIGKA